MKIHLVAPLLIPMLFALSGPVQGTVVYSNDFDNPAVVAGGVSATLTGGADVASIAPYNATYGNFHRNDSNVIPAELTLTNLPPHSEVDLNYILGFIDSWDSLDGGCCAPDQLDLYIDHSPFASYTYNQVQGTVIDIDGGTVLFDKVQYDNNIFYTDVIVDMTGDPTLKFPHSASTLTVSWIASGAGWQGSNDEAYGIDNLSIELSGVPEPSCLMLLALGTFGATAIRRR